MADITTKTKDHLVIKTMTKGLMTNRHSLTLIPVQAQPPQVSLHRILALASAACSVRVLNPARLQQNIYGICGTVA